MDTLREVAAADISYIETKDKSYGRSWRKRGGVGAFMMLARKWDRLEQFMQQDFNYDVFIGIEKSPDGSDGTTLAEIRDLRRYLLLVEGEMVARGVVEVPKSEWSVEVPMSEWSTIAQTHVPNFNEVAKVALDNLVVNGTVTVTVNEDAKRHTWAIGEKVEFGSPTTTRTGTITHFFSDSYDNQWAEVKVGDIKFVELLNDLRKISNHTEDRRVPRYEKKSHTPEDGGHHANLYPWKLELEPTDDLLKSFYFKRAEHVWLLAGFVESYYLPGPLSAAYAMAYNENNATIWCLRLDRLPEDLQDFYPKLQPELNAHEYDKSAYKYMYELDAEAQKYKIKEKFNYWRREPK
jgi:hypothetical protein